MKNGNKNQEFSVAEIVKGLEDKTLSLNEVSRTKKRECVVFMKIRGDTNFEIG